MGLWTVFAARLLALSWALFWLVFFIAESLLWRAPPLVLAAWAGVGLLFLLLAVLAWFNELTGGALLVAAGLLIGVAYVIWGPPGLPRAGRVLTTVTFSAPPLVAGALFLWRQRAMTAARSRRGGPSANGRASRVNV